MRQGYENKSLTKNQLNSNPLMQFELWFEEASKVETVPNAFSLATIGVSRGPTLRTVLLKSFDSKGFVFFTNYNSRKALQIEENPKVAMLFNWVELERQISICGVAEKIERTESFKYFMSRPHGSQLGAWVSDQSSVLSSREVLEKKLEKMKSKFKGAEVPLPDFWGGYRIKQQSFEFWQGCPNRLHDRFLYTKKDHEWLIERLAP